jgi:hypothetical protein
LNYHFKVNKMKTILLYKKVLLLFFFVILFIGCTKTNDTGSNTGNNNGTAPTITTPDTQFISSEDFLTNNLGDYWDQQFTVNATTTFVFRFASMFQAQAAIITSDQLANFTNNSTFSGVALFDKTIGTKPITLAPGTYYVAIRNETNGMNKWTTELDLSISLPASDECTFYDYYMNNSQAFPGGELLTQAFTIQSGYRYFLDGCNANFSTYIISADQVTNFNNGQSFTYFSDYYSSTGGGPGLFEITLPPGNYYLAASSSTTSAITYVMERWKVN